MRPFQVWPAALLILLLAGVAHADEAAEGAAAKDQLAKLQGTWTVVSLDKRGESVAELVKLQLQFTFQDQSLTVTAAAAPGFTPQQRIVRAARRRHSEIARPGGIRQSV